MKLIKVLTGCVTAIALTAGNAFADNEMRGAVTAVSNVASSVVAATPHNGFRWADRADTSGPTVNVPQQADRSGFRWVSQPAAVGNNSTVASEEGLDVNQTASRWIIRNDASQSASRWIIRSDADQNASRWIIRSDADQTASRWIIRNDANQTASRWIIRSDADQTASRWIIRSDADQTASRWIIR